MRSAYLRFPKLESTAAKAIMRPVLGFLLVLQLACGSAPVQEMSEARQAIEAARVAGADVRAPASYERARTLLKDAEDLLKHRHFRKARTSAVLARDEAIQARETAREAAFGD